MDYTNNNIKITKYNFYKSHDNNRQVHPQVEIRGITRKNKQQPGCQSAL